MLTISKGANPNYLAKVVQLGQPIKHPNADRMQGWIIDGNRVWTDLERKSGDICVFFPLECAINSKLLYAMSLYSDSTLNLDPEVKGYFTDKGRVKAVKLRGQPSEGFLLPLYEIEAIFNHCGSGMSIVGVEFDTINDNLLVWKYVPRNSHTTEKSSTTTNSKKKVKRFSRLVEHQFRLHEDTQQFKKNLHRINPEDNISISYKLHGTSFVVGNVLTKRKLSFKEKLGKWWGLVTGKKNVDFLHYDYTYDHVYSSRKVVKNEYINSAAKPGWYKDDLWGTIKNDLKSSIEKGYTLYGECVGYTESGEMIQKGYDYGCIQPDYISEGTGSIYQENIHYAIYIYRITHTNIDGKVIELSSQQIEEYCNKYGLKPVPYIFQGYAWDLYPYDNGDKDNWRNELLAHIEGHSHIGYQNIDCFMCTKKVPAEGVVIRKESLYSFEAFKLKSFKFLEKESKDLDSGEVDMETAECVQFITNETI